MDTFHQLNTVSKDLERKLPLIAPFLTMDELKQMIMLVGFLCLALRFITNLLMSYKALCPRQQEDILVANSPRPKFILQLGTMKNIISHISDAHDRIAAIPLDQKEKVIDFLTQMAENPQQFAKTTLPLNISRLSQIWRQLEILKQMFLADQLERRKSSLLTIVVCIGKQQPSLQAQSSRRFAYPRPCSMNTGILSTNWTLRRESWNKHSPSPHHYKLRSSWNNLLCSYVSPIIMPRIVQHLLAFS